MTAVAREGRPARGERRCRRVVSADGLRPSELLAAFFLLGIAFLLAGAVAAGFYWLGDWAHGRWLALHLVFVGGISQLVLGASQFFVGAFLATTPPARRLVRAQLATWNLGALLVAVGVPSDSDAASGAGALLLLAGLVLLAAGLRSMERQALRSAKWAVRWYYACAGFLFVGVIAGAALAARITWSAGDLLGAHLALNLAGWFGTAIVGTLHTFYPSLTQTQLAMPRLQPLCFWSWVGGTSALAAGQGFDLDWLALAGWTGLVAAGGLLAANVLACARGAPERLGLPARIVGVAQVFLLAGLVAGVAAAISDGSAVPAAGEGRSAMAVLLLAGWLGLTVLGSLVHLLSVLVRVRDLSRPAPTAPRWQELLLPPLAFGGVALLAATRLTGAEPLAAAAGAAVLAAYAGLGARCLNLARQSLRHGLPKV